MSEGEPQATRPLRMPCPHCREPLDPLARICPHCRRDASVDLVLGSPVGDRRQCYRLARALVALSPKPRLGVWVRQLERGGVVMRGVPAGLAESVRERLCAASQSATIRVHEPSASGGKLRWILASSSAAAALLAMLFAAGVMRQRALSGTASSLLTSPAQGGRVPAAGGLALSPREVAARVMPSVVVLRCHQKTGSGFFVTEHRVLTNEHVTCGPEASLAIELADGKKGEAHLVAADERRDLALVETMLVGTPLRTASAGDLATGDTVMAAGAPMGLQRSFHVGTISNSRRIMLGVCYLQIDAGINPGNSGGPLLDAAGQVVAVVSMKRDQAEAIAFAVPIDYAFDGEHPLLPPPDRHPSPGFLGMLADARRDDERLLEESRRLRMQVIRAVPVGRAHVVAAVLSASASEPEQTLSFHFEQREQTICTVSGVVTWQENHPDEGFAKRASEWMDRMGIGKVYSGAVDLDVRSCEFERGQPVELILEEGDEKLNRVPL
jgi:putative serine protease PepD